MSPQEHANPQAHWDTVFETKKVDEVSWYQTDPEMSVQLITEYSSPDKTVIDIGAGASVLVDRLLAIGYHDVTVLDISSVALTAVADRLGEQKNNVSFITSDITAWQPQHTYNLWHDRAVFHFLHDSLRAKYVELAANTITPGGHLIVGTFALDGPEQCSGLPVNRYNSEMIAEIFSDKFALIKSAQEQHHTPFGTTQSFTWTVLQRTP